MILTKMEIFLKEFENIHVKLNARQHDHRVCWKEKKSLIMEQKKLLCEKLQK